MKKILILLMLACSTANAETWLEMPNQAGGKVILLPQKCNTTNEGRIVIATSDEGPSLNGCWWYFADMIHIVWDGGKTSSFNPSSFKAREKK